MSLIALQSFSQYCLATAQVAERIIIDGQTNMMFSLPLTSYLESEGISISKYTNPPRQTQMTSSCLRGYIATWQIESGYLWLLSIQGFPSGIMAPMDELFSSTPPIKAKWYSGKLRIPKGDIIQYIHRGFDSIYEKELIIEIEDGKVIDQRYQNNVPNHPVQPIGDTRAGDSGEGRR